MNAYIDASCAVHPNIRGHAGGTFYFGHGVTHNKSSKQKINLISFTKCELVGLMEYIPYSLWIGYFLEQQGYKLKSDLVHQDNQSSIKIEINGRVSYTDNSRHANLRFFFVKDRVDKGEVRITCCSTGHMSAYFLLNHYRVDVSRSFKCNHGLEKHYCTNRNIKDEQ